MGHGTSAEAIQEHEAAGDYSKWDQDADIANVGSAVYKQRAADYAANQPVVQYEDVWVDYYKVHPFTAREQLLEDTQRAEYQTYVDTKAGVEKFNRDSYVETERAYGKMQAVAYRTSEAHLQDARAASQEFSLLAQDYVVAAGQRTQTQAAEYSRSGALITGSAAERLESTRTRGEEGAMRLEGEAGEAMRRGRSLADTVRREQVKPEYVAQSLPLDVEDPDDPAGDIFRKRAALRAGWQSQGYNRWMSRKIRVAVSGGGEASDDGGGKDSAFVDPLSPPASDEDGGGTGQGLSDEDLDEQREILRKINEGRASTASLQTADATTGQGLGASNAEGTTQVTSATTGGDFSYGGPNLAPKGKPAVVANQPFQPTIIDDAAWQ